MGDLILRRISKDLKEFCRLNKFIGKKLQIAYVEMDVIIEFRKRPKMKTYSMKNTFICIDDVGE
jgi:hypothetical protein